jgi:hypothetical protein
MAATKPGATRRVGSSPEASDRRRLDLRADASANEEADSTGTQSGGTVPPLEPIEALGA